MITPGVAATATPTPRDHQAEGLQALDRQDYPQAQAIFSRITSEDPKDYYALFNLAFAEAAQNENDAAIGHLKQVLTLKPNFPEAELNLGKLYLRTKQPSQAVPLLQNVVSAKPDNADAERALGQALLATNDPASAATAFQSATEKDPKNASAQLGLAESLRKQAKLDEAKTHFESAAQLDPQLRSYLLELAQAYEKANRPTDAIPLLLQFPDEPAAREELARLYLSAGQGDQAIQQLQAVVKSAPTTANQMALASAYIDAKHPDLAEPILAQSLRTNPNDFDVLLAVGKMEMAKHNYPVCANLFLQAAKVKPDSAEAWNNAASALILAGSYPQAIAALDHIRAMGAEKPANLYWRAVVLDKLHQPKPALASYQQFLAESQGKYPDQEFLARHRSIALEKEASR